MSRAGIIYTCKKKSSKEQCRLEFLENHPEWEYVRVKGDGNCLFRSMGEFYSRTGMILPGVDDPTDYVELRKYITGQFKNYVLQHNYLSTIIANDDAEDRRRKKIKNAERNIVTILNDLPQNCVWDTAAFEHMLPFIPSILNANLAIYKINVDNTISRTLLTPNDGPEVPITISLFLASNHYGLLYPTIPPNAALPVNEELEAVLIASKKQANLNAALKQLSLNNADLNSAIKASLEQQKINTQKQNQYNSVIHGVVQMSINNMKKKSASTRKKPPVGKLPPPVYNSNSSVVSNASLASNVSWNNSTNIANIQKKYPYTKQTVKNLKESLNVFNVPYSSKSKKEELYGTFILKMKEDVNQRIRASLQTKKQERKYANKLATRKAEREKRRSLKK
jgi:hypothetical protein